MASMPAKTTRRNLIKTGALGLAAAASGAASAQEPKEEPKVDTSEIEKQLAKPLSEQAKKLLPGAVTNSRNQHSDRMKFKLPENGEPCTVYIPSGFEKR
jgi:hypothetical protein